jgi:hypothetical protein
MVLAQGLGHAGRSSSRRQKAIIALARRLAIILHQTWTDGTRFRWRKEVNAAA